MQQALMRRGHSGVQPEVGVCVEGRHSYLLGKHVYYWIFRIFLGDVIGKMQMDFWSGCLLLIYSVCLELWITVT